MAGAMRVKKAVVEMHPADIEAQAYRGHLAQMGLVTVPEVLSVHHWDSIRN